MNATLTKSEQSAEALERANAKRSACRDYKQKIKRGEISLETAIAECDLPIRVHALLISAPFWGGAKAAAALKRARLNGDLAFAPTSRRRGITRHERTRLLLALKGKTFSEDPVPVTNPIDRRAIERALLKDVERRMYDAGCTYAQIDQVTK